MISDFSVIGFDLTGGPLEVQQFGDNFTAYSWTNGVPTESETGTGTGIWIAQPGASAGPGLNTGFEISVPADTTVRALKVYVGAYGARMHFEASLTDESAPPYVDESFFNEGDGPNRVYTLTFAAASPGQRLVVRWWTLSLADETWGNITLQSAALREAAPVVSLRAPANGSIFNSASGGLRFTASTIDPFSIAADQVGLVLNGIDVSQNLVVTGSATSRSASYTNLAPNQFYTGQIRALDNLGHGTTNFITFDTFGTNGVVVIEAEDYNHDAGQYTDYPGPGIYAGVTGVPDIDYHSLSAIGNGYRFSDPLDIVPAAETRNYFVAAGVENYAVTGLNPDDWQNYTRSFSNGNYRAYLRYGGLMDQSIQLGLVTGDVSQYDQTVTPIGIFNAPLINSEAIYRYTSLTDTNGNPITVALSGVQTLRLTGLEVTPDYGGIVTDFFMLVPFTAQPTQPKLSISSSGGQITISFPTQSGLTYTLQYKDHLGDPSWQSITPSVAGDGGVKSVTQSLGQPSRFYRLSAQ